MSNRLTMNAEYLMNEVAEEGLFGLVFKCPKLQGTISFLILPKITRDYFLF